MVAQQIAKPGRSKATKRPGSSANVGFEEKLWQAADTLRGSMDAAEYKHVVLGLIFLKYVSDSFEERRQFLMREAGDPCNCIFVGHCSGQARRLPRVPYFYLMSPTGKRLVSQHDNGSAQPNLSVRMLSNYPLPLPPIAEQKGAVAD